MRAMDAKARERAWVERTLELTLRSLGALAEAAAPAAGVETVGTIRDLADQAGIWAERLASLAGAPDRATGRDAGTEREGARIAYAALRGRVADGLAARLGDPAAPVGPETRRAALCCAPDLERHGRRAAADLRRAERRGLSERVRRAREELPSRREYLADPFDPPRPVSAAEAVPDRPCPTVPRRAFSAA